METILDLLGQRHDKLGQLAGWWVLYTQMCNFGI